MRVSALIVLAMLVTACRSDDVVSGQRLLCDPVTGEAFIVRDGVGDTSFVNRVDPKLCRVLTGQAK